jgi:PAS domain-containing protein
MSRPDLPPLLAAWRQAEGRWDATPLDDPSMPEIRRAVLRAWETYNRAAGSIAEDEVLLVADDTMTYVEAFGPTEAMLGWTNRELAGRTIADVTPTDALDLMDASWRAFVMAGRLEGLYPLRARDGRVVLSSFTARAHHPIAGLHVSRHRPAGSETAEGAELD